MLGILFLSLSAVSIFILAGYPIIKLLFLGTANDKKIEFATAISFSLILGLGLSALSTSIAYSYFGINFYFIIFAAIITIMWFLYFYFSKSKPKIKIPRNNYLAYFGAFFLASIYFAKSQWDKSLQPIIFSGGGPDVAQNLIAGMYANELGQTWNSAKSNFMLQLGSDNFRQATFDMFKLPSHADLAVVDYLVLGGRWALTVPMNQIIRIFGPQTVFLEIGSVLVITFVSLMIVLFGIGKLLNLKNAWALVLAASVTFNGAFLNQYFNGGLSQAFGLIGNIGILAILLVIISRNTLLDDKNSRIGLFLVSTSAFLSSALAYIDATFVIVAVIFAIMFVYVFINRSILLNLVKLVVIPGCVAIILAQVFIYNLFLGFRDRATAVSNTGVNVNNWKMPSQLMGLFSNYSVYNEKTPQITLTFSIVISLLMVMFLISQLRKRKSENLDFAILGLISMLGYLLSFVVGFNLPTKSDYLYSKIGVYLAPFVMTSILIILIKNLSSNKFKSITLGAILTLSLVNVGSAIAVENKFSSSKDVIIRIPKEYRELINDDATRNYLESNNYIMPYKVAYNYLALFGVKYLISKAPNDMDFDKRMDNSLRVICFLGEVSCKVNTPQINNSELNKYGIIEYESTITTSEYKALSIIDRYNFVTDILGQQRISVPDKFLGGNPYLK
jgi:hypothetical protein